MKNEKQPHITSYTQHIIVLIILLALTFTTVAVTQISFGTFSVGVALIIASVKGYTVLSYFMHLKHESRFLIFIVIGIFMLYVLIMIVTFIDYLLR